MLKGQSRTPFCNCIYCSLAKIKVICIYPIFMIENKYLVEVERVSVIGEPQLHTTSRRDITHLYTELVVT